MSIATLKRKTYVQYNNMSVDKDGFSLNGSRRSAGYVGQDMLGRSLVRSLSGSNGALKGHGGCCGKYPTSQIITSPEMLGLNNTLIVKPSSLSNNGMIMTKHRWIRRPKPYSSWKPSDSFNISNQGYYIENLAKKTISESCHDTDGNTTSYNCSNKTNTTHNYAVRWAKTPTITKPASFMSPISQSEYVRDTTKKCGANNVFWVKKNTQNIPFACGNSDSFKSV